MSTATYNCPCCGAPLAFSGESGKLECASCGNSYEPDAIQTMSAGESIDKLEFERCAETFDASEAAQMQAYVCKSCGA